MSGSRSHVATALSVVGLVLGALTTHAGASPIEDPYLDAAVHEPTPMTTNNVVFIGDSVTAGFGYCGTETASANPLSSCATNEEFSNSWGPVGYTLVGCSPPEPVDDRCSNNNARGAPWTAGPWTPSTPDKRSPTVAYSFAIAQAQASNDAAVIQNWAVTGSTPRDWDPLGVDTDPIRDEPGRFAVQLRTIHDSYVVMTLGANPLLSEYLKIGIGIPGLSKSGECANETNSGSGTLLSPYVAAPLNSAQGGLLECFSRRWAHWAQDDHLWNIWRELLDNGNHVLVVGYPMVCPWSFGNWQPTANLVQGPASGKPCDTLKDTASNVSQFDQAKFLGSQANQEILSAVETARRSFPRGENLVFAAPDADEWAKHQAWHSEPWVFANDTWIHPNRDGHIDLAVTVIEATCHHFQRWCWSGRGDLRWSSSSCTRVRDEQTNGAECPNPLAGARCEDDGWKRLEGADGRRFADEDGCVTYARAGGALATIVGLPGNPRLLASGRIITAGLTPDGSRLVYWLSEAHGPGTTSVFSVAVRGGQPVELTPPPAIGRTVSGRMTPVVSPDGRHLVYLGDMETDGVEDLFSVSLDGGRATRLNENLAADGSIAGARITPDSSRVVYRQLSPTGGELFSVPITGGIPVSLSTTSVRDFDIAADSRRVVYTAVREPAGAAELYSSSITGGAAVKLDMPAGFSIMDTSFTYAISPDSGWVVFKAVAPAKQRLYSVAIGGGTAAVRLDEPKQPSGLIGTVKLTPDSSRVVFQTIGLADGTWGLHSIPIGGGVPVQLADDFVPLVEIAPDSSVVVFVDGRDSSSYRLRVVSPSGGASRELNPPLAGGGSVSAQGGSVHFGFWVPSLHLVFFDADADGDGVVETWTAEARGGAAVRVSPTRLEVRFAPDLSYLVALQGDLVSRPTNGPVLATLNGLPDPEFPIVSFEIAADSRTVLYRERGCCGALRNLNRYYTVDMGLR